MSSTRLLDSGTMAHAIDTPATHNVIDNVQDEESLRRECSAAGVTYILPGAGRFSRELSAPLSGLLDLLIITMVIVAVQEHVLGNNNISLSDRCSAAVCVELHLCVAGRKPSPYGDCNVGNYEQQQ